MSVPRCSTLRLLPLIGLLAIPIPNPLSAQTDLEAKVRELETRIADLEGALAAIIGADIGSPIAESDSAGTSPIPISLLRKQFNSEGIQDRIEFEFAFENHLEKAVRAFTGMVVFQDLFERDVMRVRVTVEDPVEVNAVVMWEGGIDLNQFMDPHRRLPGMALEDIVTKFELDMVIFQDGTRRTFGG